MGANLMSENFFNFKFPIETNYFLKIIFQFLQQNKPGDDENEYYNITPTDESMSVVVWVFYCVQVS